MKYMVCVDGSQHSDAAFERAVSLVNPDSDELVVVTVPEIMDATNIAWKSHEKLVEFLAQYKAQYEEVQSMLESMEAKARKAGVSAVTTVRSEGQPREQIIAEATKYDVDVLVCGTRGRGEITSMLLGSVSSYLLHHAPCDVLLVRPKEGSSSSNSSE